GPWKTGMPLFRVPGGSTMGVTWTNRHTGSLLDLEPATVYEVELTLTDPDGGGAMQTLSVTTRAVPVPMAGAPVKAATPATFTTVVSGALPGDIIDLAANSYAGFTWTKDGEAAKPIVIRSTAGAVIDGNIDLFTRSYVQFDGLTVEGRMRFNQSTGIAVQRCTVHAHSDRGGGDGIVTYTRSESCYFADNLVVGTSVWTEASLGVSGTNLGEGILVTGPGHVVRNNCVRVFRDGLLFMEGASEAPDQYSIDLIENDVSECSDDGIEADYSAHNVRVLRNRLTNCFMGISCQPSLGGPTYLVRNVLYNVVYEAFKLHNGTYGDVLLNNTVVKSGDAFAVASGATISRTFARNNLLLGGPGHVWNGYDSGTGRVMHLYDLDVDTVSLDYDGYGSTAAFFTGKFGPSIVFDGLAQLHSMTTEVHATQVGLNVFAAGITYPAAAMTVFAAPDLRLAAASAAVDAGVAIPGITDGFAGSAPDLGAYELGQAAPAYGVRSPGGDSTPPATPAAPTVSGGGTATPTLSGITEPGATVRVYDGGVLIATTMADGSGAWTVTLPALSAGSHTLTVTSSDPSGNTSAPSPSVVVTAPTSGGGSSGSTSSSSSSGSSCGLGGVAATLVMLSIASGLQMRQSRQCNNLPARRVAD
ncbi:MAG TPA: Ig-like domain-containing protein, partial [Planctomycetota bacterium]|nr:Ig-like domain-containing protein [Planctomycetota bacterium]